MMTSLQLKHQVLQHFPLRLLLLHLPLQLDPVSEQVLEQVLELVLEQVLEQELEQELEQVFEQVLQALAQVLVQALTTEPRCPLHDERWAPTPHQYNAPLQKHHRHS
jgi:YesN/AraC family two-component response regulator